MRKSNIWKCKADGCAFSLTYEGSLRPLQLDQIRTHKPAHAAPAARDLNDVGPGPAGQADNQRDLLTHRTAKGIAHTLPSISLVHK